MIKTYVGSSVRLKYSSQRNTIQIDFEDAGFYSPPAVGERITITEVDQVTGDPVRIDGDVTSIARSEIADGRYVQLFDIAVTE